MAKKSKELSEEDKVTETPKKGTRGKKIVAEQTQVTEAVEETSTPEVVTVPPLTEIPAEDASDVR